MTLDKNPRDTAVGTVGDCVNIEREGEQFAIMNFQITTFGDPVVIEVEYTWHPEQTENPEIKAGMVVRIRGWMDDDRDGMMMESWEVEEDREVSVLVCGGRKFNGWTAMQRALDRISPDIIIHGAAGGADSMAGRYAQENNIPCRDFPAEWRRYGRSAGYRRNQQMLDEGKPDLVVAFPGGPGTQNMVKISRQQGFEVNIIDHRRDPKHGDNAPVVQGKKPPAMNQIRKTRGKMSTESTERKEYKYLTEDGKSLKDGKFLAELDWNMEIEVNEQEQTKQIRCNNINWEMALFCQWPKMLEEELTYYTMLNGGTDVGYRFDFKIGQEGTVTAHGTLYAARITQKLYEVFEKIVLAEADLTLRPTDPKTEGVLREFVEQGFHTHAPDPRRARRRNKNA